MISPDIVVANRPVDLDVAALTVEAPGKPNRNQWTREWTRSLLYALVYFACHVPVERLEALDMAVKRAVDVLARVRREVVDLTVELAKVAQAAVLDLENIMLDPRVVVVTMARL